MSQRHPLGLGKPESSVAPISWGTTSLSACPHLGPGRWFLPVRFCRLFSGTWWWWDVSRALDAQVPAARPPSASSPGVAGGGVLQWHQIGLCQHSLWSSPSAKMVDLKIPKSVAALFFTSLPYFYSNLSCTLGPDCRLCCFCPLLLCWTPRGLCLDDTSLGAACWCAHSPCPLPGQGR